MAKTIGSSFFIDPEGTLYYNRTPLEIDPKRWGPEAWGIPPIDYELYRRWKDISEAVSEFETVDVFAERTRGATKVRVAVVNRVWPIGGPPETFEEEARAMVRALREMGWEAAFRRYDIVEYGIEVTAESPAQARAAMEIVEKWLSAVVAKRKKGPMHWVHPWYR